MQIDLVTDPTGREDEIEALFEQTFTASEGTGEGQLIGRLARDLLADVPAEDLRVFCARAQGGDGAALTGAILFTRLRFDDPRQVFLLAPVAVATAHQRQGIGLALLRAGLDAIRQDGIDVAVTYGDPAYYSRVGFRPVSVDDVAAPLPLSMPHGWQALSLTEAPLARLPGPVTCAAPFNDPALW